MNNNWHETKKKTLHFRPSLPALGMIFLEKCAYIISFKNCETWKILHCFARTWTFSQGCIYILVVIWICLNCGIVGDVMIWNVDTSNLTNRLVFMENFDSLNIQSFHIVHDVICIQFPSKYIILQRSEEDNENGWQWRITHEKSFSEKVTIIWFSNWKSLTLSWYFRKLY